VAAGRIPALINRRGERGVLDRLIDAVRAGESRVLLVRGDPGIGKTALLNYLAERASECQVVRVAGVQSEMELAFAGLHLLCAPMLDRLDRLPETTQAGGTDSGLGLEARSRALLSDGEAANGLYREAIDRLSRTWLRPDLARAHLLYGEWLRREARRADARTQLRTAYQMLATMGAAAFAERARRELLAAGETARKRAAETRTELTAQEASIARLARHGHTNTEIGA
jgi:DNA replicative helicase MCM subunit Mcm2 (Cdc46/Mcm family)